MSRQFKLSFMDRILTFPGSSGHLSYDTGENKITYLETENGSISGDKEWALPDEVVTLSDTPDQDYIIDEYYVNGSAISGNTFLMPNEDVDVSARFKEAGYTITLLTDGNGTISADKLLCPIGETVNLSTTYNDYYRFNNYSVSGGTVNGNVLTPTENCTVKANFKLNSFVASGSFESNPGNGARGTNSYATIACYCKKSYNTDNVPSSYYDSSNRWKPNGTISGYSMTINGRFQVRGSSSSSFMKGGAWSGCLLIGSTRTQNQTSSVGRGQTATYSKSTTTSTTNVIYGVSGRLQGGDYSYGGDPQTNNFVAGSTTGGSWRATGVIK